MVALATASAAASNAASAEHVSAGDAVRLVAEQAGDGRLVITQIGGKTGEAVTQDVGRDAQAQHDASGSAIAPAPSQS
jgi:hypothetical protein